jgi:hypothetical protein
MPTYYRFDHDKPKPGDEVHCFKDLETLRRFARMMQRDDPDSRRMKYWKVDGRFVREDEGDAIVRVVSSQEIRL